MACCRTTGDNVNHLPPTKPRQQPLLLSRLDGPFHDRHFHFVTGRLAAPAVQQIVQALAAQYQFQYTIDVLPITVAALMTPRWVQRHLQPSSQTTDIVLPGHCVIAPQDPWLDELSANVILGPKDCRDLPRLFGQSPPPPSLDDYDIEIIAEINHVPRRSVDNVRTQAAALVADGADRIDLGADPSDRCATIDEYVAATRDLGVRVSIDSFDPVEVKQAVDAGADLVLSVNHSNRHAARDWWCEVVVIPDTPTDLTSLYDNTRYLMDHQVPHRADAILEPIGSGLMASLSRYQKFRLHFPNTPMMMGIGNVTELTDVDSAGVNFILLAICQELGITSVLTTQVINWARTSVRECDIARRLVRHSLEHGTPPKRLSSDLVQLRDDRLQGFDSQTITNLAAQIRDNNYRLFIDGNQLRIVSGGVDLTARDAFELFDKLLQQPQVDNIDASHAFYLGYEMAKATTAMQLGKNYEQDRALHWGMLTVPETPHRIARTSRHRNKGGGSRGAGGK